jgi:hypothetical protein
MTDIERSGPSRTVLLICAWCGPLAITLGGAGMLLAGLLPVPLGPGNTAKEVAAFYTSGAHVPLGFALASLGLSLVIPLIAVISYLMQRDETPAAKILAFVQLISGTITATCLVVPMIMMAAASLRPDRDPQLLVLVNDFAWLLFVTTVGPFIIQNIAIAASALGSGSSPFPRWIGYLNLWAGFTFTFDVLALVFRDGPFAWNKPLIFWLALTAYAIWMVAMGSTIRHLVLHGTTHRTTARQREFAR